MKPVRRSKPVVIALAVGVALVAGTFAWQPWRAPPLPIDVRDRDPTAPDSGPSDSLAAPPRPLARTLDAAVPADRRVTITGIVRLDGKPVVARVAVYVISSATEHAPLQWAQDPPKSVPGPIAAIARADSAADGRYSIEVAGPVYVRLVARDAAGHEGGAFAYCDRVGARVERDIALLAKGESLAGRVLHADGRPFRGRVVVHAAGSDVFDIEGAGSTTTDEQGRFTVHGLVPGPNVVTAFEPGRFEATSRVVAVPRDGEYVFVMDIDLQDWKGRVVDDASNVGIAGARVVAHVGEGAGRSRLTAQATTAADGSFAIRFARGNANWTIDAPGYLRLEPHRRSLDPARPIEFHMLRGHRVTGRVVNDADGTPVGGIGVFSQYSSGNPVAHVVAGPDGRFAFEGLRAGTLSIAAHGNGLTTRDIAKSLEDADPLAVRVGERTAEIEIRVVPAGSVKGRVVDAKGDPVAGAEITTWPHNTSSGPHWTFSLASIALTVTAPDGSFRLDTLIPGIAHTITATAADGRTGNDGTSVLAGAVDDEDVEIRIADGRFVEVRCTTPSGAPIAGATVRTEMTDFPHVEAETDATGTARLGPFPAIGLELSVEPPAGYAVEGETEVVADESASNPVATFVLRAKRRVAGRVYWSDGKPATDARLVSVVAGNDDGGAGVDTAGAFEFESLTADEAELRVFDDAHEEPVASVRARAGDENVEITLPVLPPPRTTIRVVGPDGKPVNGTVHVVVDEDLQGFHLQLVDGECSTRLVSGVTFVRVDPAPVTAGPVTVGPVAPGTRELLVPLPAPKSLGGIVRDAEGHGIRGLELMVIPKGLPPGFQAYSERQKRYTDADGRFRFEGLGTGGYDLRIKTPPGYDLIPPSVVESGRTDLVFDLGRPHEKRFKILDPEGKPVARARVILSSGEVGQIWTASDGEGEVTAVGLDVERNETVPLEVRPPGDRPDLLTFADKRWATKGTEVRLAAAYPIRGIVRDENGRPLAATIEVRVGSGHPTKETSESDGTFVIPHLAEGTYRLRATSIGPARESAAIDVTAGTSDVVLALERTTKWKVSFEGAGEPGTTFSVGAIERGRDWERWASADATGAATIEGVRPATRYVVVAHVEKEGEPDRVGRIEGVLGSAGTVTINLAPALRITGRVIVPAGESLWTVYASDGVETTRAAVSKAGEFTLDGLWPGRWHLWAEVENTHWRADVDVEAGGTVTLEPKEPAKGAK